jgi:hypothetical protein
MNMLITIAQNNDGLRAGRSVVDSRHDKQIFPWPIESRPALELSSPLPDEYSGFFNRGKAAGTWS